MSTNVVNKGLEDVVVSTSSISSIIDDVLTYQGYGIDDLTDNAECFEEVVYLLWHGRLPKRAELDAFKAELVKGAALPGRSPSSSGCAATWRRGACSHEEPQQTSKKRGLTNHERERGRE